MNKEECGRTVVLTGGGTAGHVMPHIALLPHLRKNFNKIYYIGSFGGIEKSLMSEYSFVEYFAVTTVKLRRSFDLRNLTIPFKLLRGVNEAKKMLRKLKPDVVFSKGGFVALPVVRAAASLKIPVVAHESDMSMGLANKISARHCKVICTTFADTAKSLTHVHTGAAIRAEIYKGNAEVANRRHFGARKINKQNLLVVGGSLGAVRINNAVRTSLKELLKTFNIVHITGKGKVDAGVEAEGYIQVEFLSDIANYYAWADVVVSRAGSNALCEMLALGKRVLLIPLSKAQSRGDQIENAKWVIQQNLASVLWDEDVSPETLVPALKKVKESNYKIMSPADIDGTEKIHRIIIDCMN